jgi:hypothetical protein
MFIFPAIVTNAELAICRFEPDQVSLADGTLQNPDEISKVPFIRFRKSLGTDFPSGAFNDLAAATRARQRTVFIVNSASLSEFLRNWAIGPLSKDGLYALQRERHR